MNSLNRETNLSIKVRFESFEDLAIFMISRATTINPLVSIMCKDAKCYSIINIDGNIVIFESPAPKDMKCRYYYINDEGSVTCTNNPHPGRVNLTLVKLAELKIEPLKNLSIEL